MRSMKLGLMAAVVVLAASASARAGEKFSLSVAPKLWASVENFNSFRNAKVSDSASGTQVAIREQVNIPLAGASVVLTPGQVPVDLLFNFYAGSTDGDFIQVVRGGTNGTTVKGTFEAKRTDVEFLARYRPEGKTWNVFTGVRVNSFEDNLKIESAQGFITNPIWTGTGTTTLERKTTIALWEVGVGFFTPLDEAGKHRFFGNTTFGIGSFNSKIDNATAGNEDEVSGGAAAWDINTGYELILGKNFSATARYRMYAKPTNALDQGYDFTVVHGPDFGLNFRF